MSRSYTLDYTYTGDLAPYFTETALPTSTKIIAEAEMITIGERNYAMISGDTSSGSIVFCVCGNGNLCVAVMFIGENAVTLRDDILSSIVFTE